MKTPSVLAALLFVLVAQSAAAQKLLLSHVAINPGQGLLWVVKDGGFLAKHGFTGDVVYIPGSPRTVQSMLAGDIDYAVAGAPAFLRARMQGADAVILTSVSGFVSQRLVLRLDSPMTSIKELRGKTIGVTQYGSAGDSFLRAALRTAGVKESEVVILQMGGTTNVAQALEAGKMEVGVLGDSSSLLFYRGKAKPLKGGSARDLGFMGLDAPLGTTERKIKTDRGAVIRFMQAYVEAIHYVKTNRAGAVRILQKYMRGLSEEHLGLWADELRGNIKPLPYPDENGLRAELDLISTTRTQPDSYFVNTSILDEIKKSGFVEKLYRQ
ncbi:MAG: ABC transporter substrate-binding protein [Deltaproteobacteria bacterium]|nr:ABC transporter substrate-binding protein [Deltaproteobacteria bacterium]